MAGFHRVPENERWIIERFGRFFEEKGPGLVWLFPALDRIREKVDLRVRQLLLFAKPVKIDFKNGSATPKETYVFVRVIDPYKSVYEIEDWKRATTSLLESAVRSYLATLTIEEGLGAQKLGYNLLGKDPQGRECVPQREVRTIRKTLKGWGLELQKVTIGDLDLDPALIKAREDVFRKQKERVTASFEKEIRAQKDMGAYLESFASSQGLTTEELQAKIASNSKLSKECRKIALDLTRRRMAIDGNSFMDIRVPDGTSLEGLIALFKKLGGSSGGHPQQPGEKEGKFTPEEDKKFFDDLAEKSKARKQKRGSY